MRVRTKILIIFALFFFISCADEKTDEELLQQDKEELAEALLSYKITLYKFIKITIKASESTDTTSQEIQAFKAVKLGENIDDWENLSVVDYLRIYREYKKMENYVSITDEDIFPPLYDVLKGKSVPNSEGERRVFIQNVEHALLSILVLLSKDLGTEIAFYEATETEPELLPDSEIKTLLQLLRGLLFFQKQLFYLSEEEFTRNIAWIESSENTSFPLTSIIFNFGQTSDAEKIGLHGLNHLLRGFDRQMMEREIDEQRAMEDFGIFLEDAQKIGLDNELVWCIDAFLHLKNEDSEKSIIALQKLRTSELLSDNEIDKIDEAIVYLGDRESGKVLNNIYDKFFLSKIVIKYIYSALSKVDWRQVLKDNEVPYTDTFFDSYDKLQEVLTTIQQYASIDKLKEEGEKLYDKAKNLLNKEE